MAGDRQRRDGGFRPVRQYQRDARAGFDAAFTRGSMAAVELAAQLQVRQRRTSGGQDGWRVGTGVLLEKADKFRGHVIDPGEATVTIAWE